MEHARKYLALALLTLLPTSCASIVHGTREDVSVTTNPPGAIVSDGVTTKTTPAVFQLKRKHDHILTISKPGYETESVKIAHVISGAVAGNLLLGGLPGWGVDAITGAQWRLEPNTITVSLRPTHLGEIATDASVDSLEEKIGELEALKQQKLLTEQEFAAAE